VASRLSEPSRIVGLVGPFVPPRDPLAIGPITPGLGGAVPRVL
jgi:hypothetical protein